jgi:hypothetical protein
MGRRCAGDSATVVVVTVGMEPPAASLMLAGGSLNALATRFLGSDFIVLFSDLLEACGDNAAARDFIIAHELGHLRAGHLRWRRLLAPGMVVPFLGSAYSRACGGPATGSAPTRVRTRNGPSTDCASWRPVPAKVGASVAARSLRNGPI